jgi:hypothetical protein
MSKKLLIISFSKNIETSSFFLISIFYPIITKIS